MLYIKQTSSFFYCYFIGFFGCVLCVAAGTPAHAFQGSVYQGTDGYLALEAEANQSPDPSRWVLESSFSGASGGQYLRTTQDAFRTPGLGILNYDFEVDSGGAFQFAMRSQIGEGNEQGSSNDTWVRLLDAAGTPIAPRDNGNDVRTGQWLKSFQNALGRWNHSASNVDNVARSISWQLEDNTRYSLQISARSNGFLLDRLILWDQEVYNLANEEDGRTSLSQQAGFDALSNSALVASQPEPEPGLASVVAGWDNFNNAATPTVTTTASGITATAAVNGAGWSNNDGSGRGSSKDTTWGTFPGPTAADAETTPVGANLTLTNGAATGDLTFTITNSGAVDLDLDSFLMDALAFRPNAARTYALNVISGDLTIGNVFTSAAPANDNSTNAITHVGGDLLTDNADPLTHDQHDDIEIDMTGLADHTLAAGESAVIQIAFTGGTGSGGGHHLFIDNVALRGTAAATEFLLGDVNLDAAVNFLDIAPFITLLTNGGFQLEADCDESGSVNFLDIAPFIAILAG